MTNPRTAAIADGLTSTPRRAAMTPPFYTGPGSVRKNLQLIRWAEAAGYDDVWLADAGGIDALTLAAIILQQTERIRVGIAVVPAYTRTPAVLAATIATLDDLAPGRFVFGLGTSSEAILGGWHGISLLRPTTRMRETTELLRQMLAGHKTDYPGMTVRSKGYRQPPTQAPVPIMLAALGPQMIDLAGSTADGVIFNLFPLTALNTLTDRVQRAVADAGRAPGSVEICSRFQVQVTSDDEASIHAARNLFRRRFTPYFATPVYNRFLASAGFADEAAAVVAAGARGNWHTARAALSDDLVDAIAVIGPERHCQDRIETYVRAGITTPILFCLSEDPHDLRRTFTAFRPLGIELQT